MITQAFYSINPLCLYVAVQYILSRKNWAPPSKPKFSQSQQ